jgi:hypothetical protein
MKRQCFPVVVDGYVRRDSMSHFDPGARAASGESIYDQFLYIVPSGHQFAEIGQDNIIVGCEHGAFRRIGKARGIAARVSGFE